MTRNGEYEERQYNDIDLRVAIGIIKDSPDESRRVRFLDPEGEERARLSGVLKYEEGEGWIRLTADDDSGLAATLTIRLDPDTRCTIGPGGTMTGTLPDGSMWLATPHWG